MRNYNSHDNNPDDACFVIKFVTLLYKPIAINKTKFKYGYNFTS